MDNESKHNIPVVPVEDDSTSEISFSSESTARLTSCKYRMSRLRLTEQGPRPPQPPMGAAFDVVVDDGGIDDMVSKFSDICVVKEEPHTDNDHIRLNSFTIDLSNATGPVKKYELVFVLYKTFSDGAQMRESRTTITSEYLPNYSIGVYEYEGSWYGGYDLSYGPNDPVRKRMRHDMQYQFFEYVKKQFGLWLGTARECCLLFDCKNTVYSNVDLRIGKEGFCHSLTDLDGLPSLVQDYVKSECRDQAQMTAISVFLNPVGEVDVGNLGDECTPDYEALHFLETLIWQSVYERYKDHAAYGKQYFDISQSRRCPIKNENLLYQVTGFEVAVQVVPCETSTSRSGYQPVLRMIPTNGVFIEDHGSLVVSLMSSFRRNTLVELEHEFRLLENVEHYSKLLNGTLVSFDHRKEIFAIDHLDKRSPSQITFNCDGKQITVKQYFYEKYRIVINSELPCVAKKVNLANNWAYYPMDVLRIVGNQKLQSRILPQELQEKVSAGSIYQPAVALKHLQDALVDMHLHEVTGKDQEDVNPFLYNYGIQVMTDCNTRPTMRSPPPTIAYDYPTQVSVHGQKWGLKSYASYICPATAPKVVFVNTCVEEIHLIPQFTAKITKKMKERRITNDNAGMRIIDLRDCFKNKEPSEMLALVEHIMCQTRAGLLFYVTAKDDTLVQDIFKTAELTNELTRKEGQRVVTQHVSTAAIGKVVGGQEKHNAHFLEGIVMKANLMLGGTNYNLANLPDSIAFSRGGLPTSLLVLGVDVRRPSKFDSNGNTSHQPTVAAMTYLFSHSSELVVRGSFWFQPSELNLQQLKARFKESLKYFAKTGGYPTDVVVYWQVPHIDTDLKTEMNELTEALNAEVRSSPPSLSLVAVDQNPKTRLFKASAIDRNAPMDQQNVEAGTWFSESSVYQDFSMISRNSGRALTRPVRYRVHGERTCGVGIEDLTNTLCYLQNTGWEALAIPSPLYGAINLSDRGLKSYNILDSIVGPFDPDTQQLEEHLEKIKSHISTRPSTMFWA